MVSSFNSIYFKSVTNELEAIAPYFRPLLFVILYRIYFFELARISLKKLPFKRKLGPCSSFRAKCSGKLKFQV